MKGGPKEILTLVEKNLEGGTKKNFDLSREKPQRGDQTGFTKVLWARGGLTLKILKIQGRGVNSLDLMDNFWRSPHNFV